MKITICASIAFLEDMRAAKVELESMGHEVIIPPAVWTLEDGSTLTCEEFYRLRHEAGQDDPRIWQLKARAMREHFDSIEASDAILVLNPEKNGIPGYIGANTLLEMGLAFWLHKPIYLLNPIPDMPYREEICGMLPVVIDGDIKRVA